MDIGAVRELEALAFRTWPARETQRIGSWLLGATDGFTRRANSALILGDPGANPEDAFAQVVNWSRRHHLSPSAKITPASPDWADPLLEAWGWKIHTPSSVMALDITGFPYRTDNALTVVADAIPTGRWLHLSTVWEDREPSTLPHHQSLLGRIPTAGFLTLREGDEPVALGLCALDGPDAYLYDLVVDPRRRGRGHGRALVHALLDWAHGRAAQRAVLQVFDTNLVARTLYRSLGFAEIYRYHYRERIEGSDIP